MREPRQTEQPEDVRTPGESYQGIVNGIGRSLIAGVVATGVLSHHLRRDTCRECIRLSRDGV